jgi:hypothetical protein
MTFSSVSRVVCQKVSSYQDCPDCFFFYQKYIENFEELIVQAPRDPPFCLLSSIISTIAEKVIQLMQPKIEQMVKDAIQPHLHPLLDKQVILEETYIENFEELIVQAPRDPPFCLLLFVVPLFVRYM